MTDTKDFKSRSLQIGPLKITWASVFRAKIHYVARSVSGHRAPLFERLVTQQETDEPWRKGHGGIFRLWPSSIGIMLGWWGDPQVDDAAGETRGLYEALTPGGMSTADRKYTPVTNLLGPISPEEVVAHAAEHVLDYVLSNPAEDEFQIIDLRDGKIL